jgi:hypothetical protein
MDAASRMEPPCKSKTSRQASRKPSSNQDTTGSQHHRATACQTHMSTLANLDCCETYR